MLVREETYTMLGVTLEIYTKCPEGNRRKLCIVIILFLKQLWAHDYSMYYPLYFVVYLK